MQTALSFLALAVSTSTQTSSAYLDSNTGISFQRYEDMTGFGFGMVLPEDPGTDFIGQMVSS